MADGFFSRLSLGNIYDKVFLSMELIPDYPAFGGRAPGSLGISKSELHVPLQANFCNFNLCKMISCSLERGVPARHQSCLCLREGAKFNPTLLIPGQLLV